MIYDIAKYLTNKNNYDEVRKLLGILQADIITDEVEKKQNEAIKRLFEIGENKIIEILKLKKAV